MTFVKLRFIALATFLLCSLHVAEAAEIHIATGNTQNSYTLYLDYVDKLAGAKITLKYPADYLHFESASKGSPFNSFIHVLNDKNPGKLIFVMARAKGISGSNLHLLTLHFKQLSPVSTSNKNRLQISQCQLMNDALQEISCNSVTLPLNISSP